MAAKRKTATDAVKLFL